MRQKNRQEGDCLSTGPMEGFGKKVLDMIGGSVIFRD
jgi:hypothetical protein